MKKKILLLSDDFRTPMGTAGIMQRMIEEMKTTGKLLWHKARISEIVTTHGNPYGGMVWITIPFVLNNPDSGYHVVRGCLANVIHEMLHKKQLPTPDGARLYTEIRVSMDPATGSLIVEYPVRGLSDGEMDKYRKYFFSKMV